MTATRRFNMIPLRQDLLDAHGVWVSVETLRSWRQKHIHPELFLVIAHRILLDLDAWDRHMVRPASMKRDHILDIIKI